MNDIFDKNHSDPMDKASDYHSGLNVIKYYITKLEKTPKAFATGFSYIFVAVIILVFIG